MTEQIVCERCGWDPRGSERFHRCVVVLAELRPGTKVAGPAKGGGEVLGTVLELQRGPAGVSALVKWQGQLSGTWYPPARLRLVVDEAAA